MFDDYDTTNAFINYDKTFDIKSTDDLEKTINDIVFLIMKDDTYTSKNTVEKDIKKLINNGINGLNILDSRHVASICLRYCHYFDIIKEPKWYLLRLWKR